MSGPTPKPAELRQRRNKESTAAELDAVVSTRSKLPTRLPDRMVRVEQNTIDENGDPKVEYVETVLEWHPMTQVEWRHIRRSPMAIQGQYIETDIDGLFMLMELYDRFHWTRDPKIMAEIRLQRGCYGLAPIDRRRLQWEIKADKPSRQPRKATTRQPPVAPSEDPRSLFSIVPAAGGQQ